MRYGKVLINKCFVDAQAHFTSYAVDLHRPLLEKTLVPAITDVALPSAHGCWAQKQQSLARLSMFKRYINDAAKLCQTQKQQSLALLIPQICCPGRKSWPAIQAVSCAGSQGFGGHLRLQSRRRHQLGQVREFAGVQA